VQLRAHIKGQHRSRQRVPVATRSRGAAAINRRISARSPARSTTSPVSGLARQLRAGSASALRSAFTSVLWQKRTAVLWQKRAATSAQSISGSCRCARI